MERNGDPVVRELCPNDQGLPLGLAAQCDVCCHPCVCLLLELVYQAGSTTCQSCGSSGTNLGGLV